MKASQMADQIFDELLLSDARGGRKRPKPLDVTIERELTPEDLLTFNSASPAVIGARSAITRIRHAHHQLARLIAQGTQQSEISLITGYSPAYISLIKNDPAVKELIEYYSAQRDAIFVDVVERMRSLGLSTLDELQRRLEEETTTFTPRELMELAKLTIIEPQQRGQGIAPGASGAPSASVNITFVQADHPALPDRTSGPTIEGTALKE